MSRRVSRARSSVTVLLGVVATLGLLLGAGTASAAVPAPPGAKAEADRVMRLSYGDFIAYKNRPSHPYGFDFSTDGCSGQPNIPPPEFDQPCQFHDFGYRNYGESTGFELGRNEQTRLYIDNRFHDEMDRECDDNHRGFAQQGNNQVCHYQAKVVYNGVRQFGGGPFAS